jgi:hypothetical protein
MFLKQCENRLNHVENILQNEECSASGISTEAISGYYILAEEPQGKYKMKDNGRKKHEKLGCR